jgi:hypothetical protein
VILILLLVIAAGGLLGFVKHQGTRAQQELYIEVRRLTADQIIDIGTQRSGALAQRVSAPGGFVDRSLGRGAVCSTAEGLTWDAASRAGIMTFRLTASPDGSGIRVSGFASKQRLAVRNSAAGGIRGAMSTAADMLARLLRVPRDPWFLIRQRREVLRAIGAADDAAVLHHQ